MFRRIPLILVLMATVCLMVACSGDNDPGRPASGDESLSAVLSGAVPGDLADFEISAALGKGSGGPDSGALLVRGRNIAYDAEAGVLTLDFSVVNDGDTDYPEPVALAFMQLLPTGVTVLEADNGETGPGATFAFGFENKDGVWTPGEESLPRAMKFVVDAGVSVGFMGRIDVGMSLLGGAIGGMVWNDADEDGEIDDGEEGEPGVSVALYGGEGTAAGPLGTVETAVDGTYRFDGLDAGYYTVVRMARDGLMGTTPAEMGVILVEADGTVSDFLLANFGVVSGDEPGGDDISVGDYIHAKGEYAADPHRLVAEIYSVCFCDDVQDKDRDGDDDGDDDYDDDCDEDCDEDCDDGCRENDCWGLLAGPVTGFSREDHSVEIMGTPVYFTEKCDWDEVEHGLRLRVKAARDQDAQDADVVACGRVKWWNGNRDRISGFVQEVVRGDDDRIMGVVVLNTYVQLSDEVMPSLGSIAGVVFDDLNGNREQDDGEPGIAGLGLRLAGAAEDSVTSGEDGGYVFDGLEAGDYAVTCDTPEGMVSTTGGDVLDIRLEAGQTIDDAHFGWMDEASIGAAIIGGMVWEDLNGDGVVDDGEPGIMGATVELSGDFAATTVTGSDGTYAFANLTAGEYVVTSTGPEGWTATTSSVLNITLAADDEIHEGASFGWWAPVTSSR